MFANYCWKIIRITDTNSIKLIYNGSPTSKTCNNTTQTSTYIESSKYNSAHNQHKYVGYMYGSSNTSYSDATTNKNDSTAKFVVDAWYKNYMTDLTPYLDKNTYFCNDRSLYSGTGYGTSTTYYAAYNRLVINNRPTFKCTNTNDQFTVTSASIGNKVLTYPVGLITADEMVFAGHSAIKTSDSSTKPNTSYYLYNGQTNWTMTPSGFYTDMARVFKITADFSLSSSGTPANASKGGIRPVIALKSCVQYNGGDGTLTNPYTITATDSCLAQ